MSSHTELSSAVLSALCYQKRSKDVCVAIIEWVTTSKSTLFLTAAHSQASIFGGQKFTVVRDVFKMHIDRLNLQSLH